MLYSTLFLRLYSKIIEDDCIKNDVDEVDVQEAIGNMHDVYNGKPENLSKETYPIANYNKMAQRCAYLHKYAPMHTALVYETMSRALTENPRNLPTFQELIHTKMPFKICSLGSGPGTDVIGVLAALYDRFSYFPTRATLVDVMPEWEKSFASVVSKLRLKPHIFGKLSTSMSVRYFDWSFMDADLQKEIRQDLKMVIKSANLITMVKFVSAAACMKTSEMIEKIFGIMKPGSMILFIDNAGGGFQELITAAARKHHLVPIFGPLHHEPYINETFNQKKFGYKSCYKTRVAVQLLRKVDRRQFCTGMDLSSQRYPVQANYFQGHLLQHRYPAQNIRMPGRRNDILIREPFVSHNANARHFVPFRYQSNFNHRGFNVLPQSYYPFFT